MIDIKNIIDQVVSEMTAKIEQPKIEVTSEQVVKRASEMAQRGYKPTEGSVKALEAYLKGYGLWLSGNVGTGKTAFFKSVRPLNIKHPYTHEIPKIVIFSMLGTVGSSVDSLNERLEDTMNDELVLDDIGAEPVFNFYGGKFEILPYILERRMESKCRTHITTNQKPRELCERYGARVIDRFSEMFVNIDFTGKSMRHSKPNERIVEAYANFKKTSGGTK